MLFLQFLENLVVPFLVVHKDQDFSVICSVLRMLVLLWSRIFFWGYF